MLLWEAWYAGQTSQSMAGHLLSATQALVQDTVLKRQKGAGSAAPDSPNRASKSASTSEESALMPMRQPIAANPLSHTGESDP